MLTTLALMLVLAGGGQSAVGPAAPQVQAPAQTQRQTGAPANDANKKPPEAVTTGEPMQAGTIRAQRRAARLYLEGAEMVKRQQPEEAWKLLQQAAELDPGNTIYARAAEMAKQSAVTQLVEQASRERAAGTSEKAVDADKLLEHALEIDPQNPLVKEHWNEIGDTAAEAGSAIDRTAIDSAAVGSSVNNGQMRKEGEIDDVVAVQPNGSLHSFHLRSNAKQAIEEVFRAYGVEASIHSSVSPSPIRFDIDDASFAQATRVLAMVTKTFYEPLDPHRVVVAQDTREFRTQFQRLQSETVYMPGLTDKELTDLNDLARNAFDIQQATVQLTQRTMTMRGLPHAIAAFNKTVGALEVGRNQIDLDVKVIELSHINTRETGTALFQQTAVYNVASEAASIISANQAAVQEIIAAGLVPNANGLQNQLTIIGLLLAAGQLTGPPFNQGFIVFGKGVATSLLTVSPATLAFNLNSSDTRALDDIHMRLQDDEPGTFKIGSRYPIETSSFSSVALPAIAGLNLAAAAQAQTVPQIEYQDIGLTLKATPKVMRSGDVALTIDLKIQALGGTALNDIPILDSRAVTGVMTLPAGETAMMVSDLSRSELRALNGMPGISDLPGLQDVSDITRNQNVARLLILVTPRLLRETRLVAQGPRILLDKGTPGR
jgi:general secretion pathway protein D